MRERELELCHSKLVQRAYSLLCADRPAIIRHLQLRVVREFGLPDSAVKVLQNSSGGMMSPPSDHRRTGSAPTCHDLATSGSGTCRLLAVGGAAAGLATGRHWQHVLVQSHAPLHHCQMDAGRHSPLVLAPMGPQPPFEVTYYLFILQLSRRISVVFQGP